MLRAPEGHYRMCTNEKPSVAPDEAAKAEAPETAASAATTPSTAALSPAEIEELKASAAKSAEHWDHYLRVRADLENYRKRAMRERQDAVRLANVGLFEKLIPVLDSFDAAVAATSSSGPPTLESLQRGLEMVHTQLRKALTEAGLQEIDAAGQPFDPNFHEAIAQQETAEVPEGQVVHQVRKGYSFHERLIRPATVVVARPPAS
jgi:molecular chaperone GrpE